MFRICNPGRVLLFATGDNMQMQTHRRAVLVLGSHDALNAGTMASGMKGVEGVTADPKRGQVRVCYDPHTVEAQDIRRALLPLADIDDSSVRLLLTAWPKLAQVLPAAARML
jgi:dihydrodipicolinate synthase/N-acetylneuraminate lyase